MKYPQLNSSLFERNRKKVMKYLQPNSLVVIHANDQMHRNGDQYFPFRQSSDLFYLTGIDQEKTILTLCPNHPNKDLREILFIIESNEKIAVWEGHKYTKDEAERTSGIKTIKYISEFNTTFRDLAINTDSIKPYSEHYQKYVKIIQDLTKMVGGIKYKDWKVLDKTNGVSIYVGLDMEYRFEIKNSKTETPIDLTFGKTFRGNKFGKDYLLVASEYRIKY
jgi:hypothetical protein